MDKNKILIGADPELFAFRDGVHVSVHDILPGTKIAPVEVPCGAIQVDGVAAEFNIQPADSEEVFYKNVRTVRNFISNFIAANNKGMYLVAKPTAVFGKEYFDALPDYVKALGCEPDYSAYTGQPNPKPETTEPFRTGSGHVHIGWTSVSDEELGKEHFIHCCNLVKELDATLLPVSYLWDSDETRRKLYGARGSFRPKKYGVEYRVLSNAWVDSEWATRFVYNITHEVTERFLNGVSVSKELAGMGETDGSFEELFHRFEVLSLPLPPVEVQEAYLQLN